jgi:alkylation response protein AidB-like acyl-CoA dehydrogenase
VLDRSPPLSAPDDRAQREEALWKELGQAGLLGLALPAWLGGDGLGVMDTAVLLTEVGRRAAPVPALATLETAALYRWLDIQAKRKTVLTFGGGVNEIQRELIATAGLGLPRVPR